MFADVAMITGAGDSEDEAVVVVVVVEPDTPDVSCEGGQEHIVGEGVTLAISATGAPDIGVTPWSSGFVPSPGESGDVDERVVTVQEHPPSSDDN